MTAVLIGRYPDQSPEWYAARASRLGGSEIAAVVGLSRWESAFSLWHRKAGSIGGQTETRQMSWGKRHEPTITAKFLEDHPEFVIQPGGTFHHEARPWQLANPDALFFDADGRTRLLEVKTADAFNASEWGLAGTDQIPDYYRCQVTWYLDVFGFEQAHVMVLIGGNDDREYIITYDPAEAERLRDAGRAFLDTVEAGEAPPLDGHDATYLAVRDLHPDIDGEDVELPEAVAVDFVAAVASKKTATTECKRLTSVVADLMGDAKRATFDGRTIARRQSKQGGTPFVVAAKPPPEGTTT